MARPSVLLGLFVFLLPAIAEAQELDLSKNPIQLIGYAKSIRTVWFSGDGQHLFGDYDDIVKWSLASKEIVSRTPIAGYKTNRSFVSSDGKLWVQGNNKYKDPKKRDIANMYASLDSTDFEGKISSRKMGAHIGIGTFIPGTKKAIVVASEKGVFRVRQLDPTTGELSTTFFDGKKSKSIPSAVAVSADGKLLAVGMSGKKKGVMLYRLAKPRKGKLLRTKDEIPSVAFAGDALFAGGYGGTIYRWGPGFKRATRIKSPIKISQLAVHPSGKHAVVAGRDGSHLIDLGKKKAVRELAKGSVWDVAFSPDGKAVALGLKKTLSVDKIASVYVYVSK